jgi:beta-lactamase superfamily II metal-dependent hydrolase
MYIIVCGIISNKLSDSSSFRSFAFEMLPGWLQGFLGAQIAIFVGMMGPLSAFYFGQLSLAAPVANIIAIPLIGIIVQIGLIAGLFGAFIPGVGIYFALVLNAANWLAVKFFLGMATFFSILIPFPRVSQPGFIELATYYVILHFFFFRKEIFSYAKAVFSAVADLWEDPEYKVSLSMLLILATIMATATGVWALSTLETRPDFRATMLDVGYGSAVLVESKNRVILIDSGLNDTLAETDRGERVVQPALSGRQIPQIDAVILTSALPERISGLASVLRAYKVNKIYAPFPLPENRKKISFDEFATKISLSDMRMERKLKRTGKAGVPSDFYWELAYNSYNRLVEDIDQFNIPFEQISAGFVVPESEGTIEVLYPERLKKRFSNYYDGLVMKIKADERNILFCSGNFHPVNKIVSFKPDYIFLADLPYPWKKFERFAKNRNPEGIAVSFRFPASWLMDGYHMAGTISGRSKSYLPRLRELRFPVFITADNGAIEVEKAGSFFNFYPYVKD